MQNVDQVEQVPEDSEIESSGVDLDAPLKSPLSRKSLAPETKRINLRYIKAREKLEKASEIF